jgi:hypothetical protein
MKKKEWENKKMKDIRNRVNSKEKIRIETKLVENKL